MLTLRKKLAVPALAVLFALPAAPAFAAPWYPISKHATLSGCNEAQIQWHETHPNVRGLRTQCTKISETPYRGWYQMSSNK